jgi:RND family efflux transporter MFP subunit
MGNPARLEELRIDRAKPARRAWRRWLWLGLGAIICAGIGVGLWARNEAAAPVAAAAATQPQAQSAESGIPPPGSLLDATGYVVARRQATVSSKITGKLIEVLVEEGQHVKAGDVLARLDSANASVALAQAQALVAQAEAAQKAAEVALEDAEPTFKRSEEQFRRGLTSADTVEAARSGYNAKKMAIAVAQETTAAARASVDVAKQNLDDTIVRAPFSGVVTVKAAEPGEMVSPAATGGFTRTGICTIVDMDSLEVEVDVSESFISRVQPQLPVTVRLNAYPDWDIPAKVLTVIPTADRAKATVKVRVALITKDPRIVPEMGARVAFHDAAPAPAGGSR